MMRSMVLVVLVLVPMNCFPQSVRSQTAEKTDGWKAENGYWVQYQNGKPVWRYSEETHEWQPFKDGQWGKPWKSKQNFGVDETKLHGKQVPTYTVTRKCRCNTDQCPGSRTTSLSKIEAMEMVAANLSDDSTMPRLTLIGSEEKCKQVLADLDAAPDLAPYKGHYVIKDYRPDHWAVRSVGFTTDGQPTIYVQAPDGRVLHKQRDYQDGAAGLALALRKTDPSYQPEKDKDVRKPPPSAPLSVGALAGVPAGAFILAGAIGVGLVWRKK